MNNHKPLKIILVALILLIAVISVGCYFVFRDIKNKNENYHNLAYDLTYQNDKESYLITTQKTLSSIDLELTKTGDSLVAKDGDVEFIESLEALARGNGLTIEITSLVFEDSIKAASTTAGVFRVKAGTKGSWANNYKFLALLESLPIKVRIDRFSITNTASETTTGKSSASTWQGAFEIAVLKSK